MAYEASLQRVIILTQARPGKVHDKRRLDEEDLVGNIVVGAKLFSDRGRSFTFPSHMTGPVNWLQTVDAMNEI